jgi:NitT/TauT family transport system permease protein
MTDARSTTENAFLRRCRDSIVPALIIVAVLVLWEFVCRRAWISPLILPSPTVIGGQLFLSLREAVVGGPMRQHIYVTFTEILAGFGLSVAVSMILGVLIAELPAARRALMPYLVMLNAAPKIAFAPLLVIWFGFGASPKIVMAALVAFFPLLVNVVTGLVNTDEGKLRLMQSLAATRWMTLTKVKLPEALPMVFAGLKSAITLTVVGAIVGEFVGGDRGLGYVIKRTEYELNVGLTFAAIVLLSTIGILLFYAIEFFERRIVFWTGPRK